mmetsp:Transcript_56765/g.122694  ORF Transcript_56765/g.122694 Transcript_56765/m.122694 type:complete len:195 (-) Transcript_56765:100-684(-)
MSMNPCSPRQPCASSCILMVRKNGHARYAKCNPRYFGTKMCKFYVQGRCEKGASCTFSHSVDELRATPDLYRTDVCFEYTRLGTCKWGSRCKYAHSSGEVHQRPRLDLASRTLQLGMQQVAPNRGHHPTDFPGGLCLKLDESCAPATLRPQSFGPKKGRALRDVYGTLTVVNTFLAVVPGQPKSARCRARSSDF